MNKDDTKRLKAALAEHRSEEGSELNIVLDIAPQVEQAKRKALGQPARSRRATAASQNMTQAGGGAKLWLHKMAKEHPHLKTEMMAIVVRRDLTQIQKMGAIKRLCATSPAAPLELLEA